MKCKCHSTLTDNNTYAINDTNQLSAKRLLMYFLETFNPIEELLYKTETVQAIYAFTDKQNIDNEQEKLLTILENLPWEVCVCFYRFITESPHIHITID